MDKKADLPAVNWLVHVLTTKTFPPGPVLIIDRSMGTSQDLGITFDSEYTRSLFIELAKLYRDNERELIRLRQEERADEWRPASDPPDNSPHLSVDNRTVLVTSPALQFVVPNGVAMGFHNRRKGWHVELNGKVARHNVTHWRYLPPPPNKAPAFETVRQEAERLRSESGG